MCKIYFHFYFCVQITLGYCFFNILSRQSCEEYRALKNKDSYSEPISKVFYNVLILSMYSTSRLV